MYFIVSIFNESESKCNSKWNSMGEPVTARRDRAPVRWLLVLASLLLLLLMGPSWMSGGVGGGDGHGAGRVAVGRSSTDGVVIDGGWVVQAHSSTRASLYHVIHAVARLHHVTHWSLSLISWCCSHWMMQRFTRLWNYVLFVYQRRHRELFNPWHECMKYKPSREAHISPIDNSDLANRQLWNRRYRGLRWRKSNSTVSATVLVSSPFAQCELHEVRDCNETYHQTIAPFRPSHHRAVTHTGWTGHLRIEIVKNTERSRIKNNARSKISSLRDRIASAKKELRGTY